MLPAFPGKSPNHEKVLGILPDEAERVSLTFLGDLCDRIKSYYSPGAKLIIFSDGRVLSDVFGIKDNFITYYRYELEIIIEHLAQNDISIFTLEDFYQDSSHDDMRRKLLREYGEHPQRIQEIVKSRSPRSDRPDHIELKNLYTGLVKFLFEDARFYGQHKSKTKLQKEARVKAYEVIRRSNAWSRLIADRFPDAIRLSIHPQVCGSKKLGIRLIGDETWMTPWHGVAVETPGGYALKKRSEAEALGAKVVHSSDGLPSHYRLI